MSSPTVLLVDDEPDILQLLEITLQGMGLNTRTAMTLAAAQAALNAQKPDLCLTDMRLPDGSGLSLIETLQGQYPDVPVAMITAHGTVESAIEALKLGAFDFVTKPIALDRLRSLVSNALEVERQPAEPDTPELVGHSEATRQLRQQVVRVARSQAPVHISGESGVGKEVVARLIHRLGPRDAKPFIAVNCGAIPPELVESELFGHKKGAFTGAARDNPGLFQAASGGTLLLDEIADLPLPVQVKLLRVIQEKTVRPVGADTEIPTDVRLLSATHKNLAAEVAEGRFRDDLFYRINVLGVQVPPLRERTDDILPIARHLLTQYATEQGEETKTLSKDAENALLTYDYPGNIRELDNILIRALALTDNESLSQNDLQFDGPARATRATPTAAVAEREAAQSRPLPTASNSPTAVSESLLASVDGDLEGYLANIERQVLEQALQHYRWNKTAAAKGLGVSFRSLRYRLKKLGLDD